MKTTSNKYGIIIDTEEYSGNFERELCAFLTGHVGDCRVGDEFEHKNPLFDSVISVPDENGCYRPCEIYPTEGWFNNGVGKHFKNGSEGSDEQALEHYKQHIFDYKTKNIENVERTKQRLISGENVHGWTIEACDREIQRYEKERSESQARTEVTKYPSYQSVIIYLSKPATQDQIDYIKEKITGFQDSMRAKRSYMKDFKFTFTGMRLMEEITEQNVQKYEKTV